MKIFKGLVCSLLLFTVGCSNVLTSSFLSVPNKPSTSLISNNHSSSILNVVCEDRILLVDGAWDYLQDFGWTNYLPAWLKREYDETAKNVKIAHFAGQRKPWVNNSNNSDKFWDTCARTPFFEDVMKRLDANFDFKNSRLAKILEERNSSHQPQPFV